MKIQIKRIICGLLIAAMMLQILPPPVFAADVGSESEANTQVNTVETDPTIADVESTDEVYIESEMTEARDEYVKHYALSDGSFLATQYEFPIHYEENSKWVDIDNTLQQVSMSDGESFYQAVNGDKAQMFAATLANGDVMSIVNGDYAISLSLWENDEEAD